MDLAYSTRRVRMAGTVLFILGLVVLGAGVGLVTFGEPNAEGPHFGPGMLSAGVGMIVLVLGGALHLLAWLGRRRA